MEEREHACDEAVLQLGNPPHLYAESILKTCEFCVESPLACVSGVTGADLKNRIACIMTGQVALKLDLRKKLLLGGVGIVIVAVSIAFGLTNAMQSGSGPQAQEGGPKIPEFAVASIKPDKSGIRMISVRFTPDGFSAANVPLKMLVSMAYGISQDLLSVGPGWVNSARFDIEAKVAGPDVAELQKLSYPQRGPMLQPLLADRFKLKVHPETKLLALYDLTIAKGGSKLREAKPGDTYPNAVKDLDGVHADLMSWGPGQIEDQVVPIASFANVLSQLLHHNIVDKTGLTGRYEIKLRWAREEGPNPPA